ncbi:MAG: hypothetical protein U0326_17520 [Polyangiales bacterium]
MRRDDGALVMNARPLLSHVAAAPPRRFERVAAAVAVTHPRSRASRVAP